MIEFRHGPDRLPAAQRVAILTRDAEAPLRTERVGGRLRLATRRLSAGNHRKRDYQIKKDCRPQGSPNSTREDSDSRDGYFKVDQ